MRKRQRRRVRPCGINFYAVRFITCARATRRLFFAVSTSYRNLTSASVNRPWKRMNIAIYRDRQSIEIESCY